VEAVDMSPDPNVFDSLEAAEDCLRGHGYVPLAADLDAGRRTWIAEGKIATVMAIIGQRWRVLRLLADGEKTL
jgi:hypothetical protein